jgi:FO synthase
MLYPVDYPLLTPNVIAALVEGFRGRANTQSIAIPSYRGRGGHPVIFDATVRREIEHARTAREVVYRDKRRVLRIDVGTDAIWLDMDSQAALRTRVREYNARSRQVRSQQTSAADLRGYLSDVRGGLPITPEKACDLIRCGDDVLPDLLAAAVDLKQQFKPDIVTYSRKVFIPLTNLCRDYCGYCIFRRDANQRGAHTMTPDEVLAVAYQGEKLGCREALFSLGDKPESVFPEMRATLRRLGYSSTLAYLEAMCELVLRETGLIPHANPGLMSAEWLRRLRAVSPSIGLMLESTSTRLLQTVAHRRAPDKVPSRRLAVIEAAGRQRIPFTTGILVGIGETAEERVNSLFTIAGLHRRHGHIQEVIVQNFRRKPGLPMEKRSEPDMAMMLRTIAVARLILPRMNIQAPPNLSAPGYQRLLEAGINDWGGVSPLTPDFINPERPWPLLAELEQRTRAAGCELRQRLPVYPEFLFMVAEAGGEIADKTFAAADAEGYALTNHNPEATARSVLRSTTVPVKKAARSCA